jgi:hypothetical protein
MNYSRQDEVFCPPVSTINGGGSAFSRHISRPTNPMDNPKDDVFSRPPVPGLNGLPRERKHRFSGNGGGSPSAAGLLRIKVEPQAAFPVNGGGVTSPYSSQQPPLIPPNCIKSESGGMAFKRYESYPPPGSQIALVSGNSHGSELIQPPNGSPNSVQYQQNMRRYSLPEYKLHQLHEPPHPDILTPLNLTRRSSSSEIVHAAASPRPRYYSYQGSATTAAANSMFQTATASSLQLMHHPDVKRELPDGDFEPADGLHNHFVFGGSGPEDHLPPHLQQQRSRLSLSSSKCRQNGGSEDPSVEAVYRDYGGRQQESDYDAAVSPSRPISGGSSNVEVYRGEFESSRMREAADGPVVGGMTAKKEPDLDGKTSAGNRGSGRTIIGSFFNDPKVFILIFSKTLLKNIVI